MGIGIVGRTEIGKELLNCGDQLQSDNIVVSMIRRDRKSYGGWMFEEGEKSIIESTRFHDILRTCNFIHSKSSRKIH